MQNGTVQITTKKRKKKKKKKNIQVRVQGMTTINNEIFFLSLYQVYYYSYLYLVKLLPSTQTTCTHTLSLNFLIFTTNKL